MGSVGRDKTTALSRSTLPKVLAPLALLMVVGAADTAGADQGHAPPRHERSASCPWLDPGLSIAQRVTAVVGAMSTADKLDLVEGSGRPPPGVTGLLVGSTKALPGLCIPALTLTDGPAGVGDELHGATQLPTPIALASTWSPQLASEYGIVIGEEQRAKGTDVELGPTINIQRDPRWGRNSETFSEDPYLTELVSVPEIQAIQAHGVIDEVKHFAVYNQETHRTLPSDDAVVSTRVLQEIYLPAFHAAVSQGGAGAIMCSYNRINGVPACQNPYLLTTVLRSMWGFTGYTSSDYLATHSTVGSIGAGLDQEMPGGLINYFGRPLQQDLANGSVTVAALDAMVAPILSTMFRFNLMSDPPTGSATATVTSPAHAEVALEVAEAGTVLLKNAGNVLPLRSPASIAVIGPDGGVYPMSGTTGGSARVIATSVVSPIQGLTARFGPNAAVAYAQGVAPPTCTAAEGPPSSPSLDQAVGLARNSSVAVVFVNDCEAEGADRTTLSLPGQQNRLIQAVAAVNPKTIVVLNTGGPVSMPWIRSVAGVVEAWYPGQADGTAIAAVLAGDVDPSGHLPETFPLSLSQVPASSPAAFPGRGGVVEYKEGLFVGYRWYDQRHLTPLFPFGFGLSYTRFTLGHLAVSRSAATGLVDVSVRVTNVGSRAGTDVVQLYVGDPPSTGEPKDALAGAKRATLQPGSSAVVSFTLGAGAFEIWSTPSNRFVIPGGTYRVLVGDASRGAIVHASVAVARSRT